VTAGGLDLRVLPGALAVARLHPDEPPPAWAAPAGALHALVRTADELSIVCADEAVPPGVQAERGFRAIAVAGPLDFGLTGVLAALAVPLAEAGVPIFAVSTFDTDHLLVRAARLDAAIAALRAAGHRVDASRPAS
jgi:hypothetical protein